MTKDEIIELAIQGHASTRDAIRWAMNQAILAEREACAKVCEEQYEYYGHDHVFAAAIRNRSNT